MESWKSAEDGLPRPGAFVEFIRVGVDTFGPFENAQQADGVRSSADRQSGKSNTRVYRVIDFLSGVIYAPDGYIERCDKIFFTLSNYVIEVENVDRQPQVSALFTRIDRHRDLCACVLSY